MEKQANKHALDEFASFAAKVTKVPQNTNSYRNSSGQSYSRVSADGFSKETIRQILESGDPSELRELSKYYARFSGPYGRSLWYYATLLNYAYVIVPHYDVDSRPKKIKQFYKKIAKYIKELRLESILPRINITILSEGVYFGLLIEDEEGKPSFYRLPEKYCRSRFYDGNGLPILELNLSYFDFITNDAVERKLILKLFPKNVQAAYNKPNKKEKDRWVEITPENGGLCFFFSEDKTPPFAATALSAQELEDARERESKHDTNELRKLLIQKFPVNKTDGELLFTLPEVELLHESVCNMLSDDDTIDVITTYADISLESVQDTEANASSSSTRLAKYLANIYNDLGTSSAIFNADSGSTAITYSIKKDITLMYIWSQQFETAINAWLRRKSKTNALYFTIKFLPTSSIFRKEDVDTYLKTAQYGYPKSAVSAAMGLDTIDLTQISDFENNVLKLGELMTPLSSSYTSSDEKKFVSTEKRNTTSTSQKDITDEGGRPQKGVEERADKTDKNLEGST